MDCHLFAILTQKYHDGELDAAERAAFERHRESCAACAEIDRRYAEVFSALDAIPLHEPSADFNGRVMERVDVARYRTSAARRFAGGLGRFVERVPYPIRRLTPVAVAFALFVIVYRPFSTFLLDAGQHGAALVGSLMIGAREIWAHSGVLVNNLLSAQNYRLAAEVLGRAGGKVFSSISPLYWGVAVAFLAIVVVTLVWTARGSWSKGETDAGLY
ncbi:MAG: zf-HC2 domain-containing protein [Candidatus Krumholzibacteriota bacterium]|nr:zf-HC2 domain-containing protein [Candidatus Krumholzibacteriota bacterium]